MPTKKTDLDACPVDSCDADVSQAFVTTDGTKLTTENMAQARTCLHPTTLDGQPASYIVFHDDLDPGHSEPDVPVKEIEDDTDDADAGDGDAEPDAGSEDDDAAETANGRAVDDLSDDSKTVFKRVMENEPIDPSGLAGKCLTDDLSPTHAKGIADALDKAGHLDKTDDGKYVTG